MARGSVREDRYPVFRSSRFYAPAVINPKMLTYRMAVSKNDWSRSFPEPSATEIDKAYFEVSASSFYMYGYEPYRAFQLEPNGFGWVAEIQEGIDNWIELDMDFNWKTPYEDQFDYDAEMYVKEWSSYFKVTKLEIFNQENKDWICKKFEFQGYDGYDWQTIRECQIVNKDPSPVVVSELPEPNSAFANYIYQVGSNYYNCVKNSNDTYSWQRRTGKYAKPRNVSVFETTDHPNAEEDNHQEGYYKYRLVVQVPVGEEKVGFACINMYTLLDHDEITYGTVSYKKNTWPRMWEKIFSSNDETSDVVWEKLHDNHLLIAATSWYPGSYAATSFSIGIMHPNDTIVVPKIVKYQGKWVKMDVEYSNGPFVVTHPIGGESVIQTKDYIITRTGSYYYSPRNYIRYTHNGKDWTKTVGAPAGFWEGQGGGWSTKDNIGMCAGRPFGKDSGPSYIWRLELDGTGVKIDQLYEVGKDGIVGNTPVGNMIPQGTWKNEHGLNCYRFMTPDGVIHNSNLQAQYQWTDMERPPESRVITSDCNWSICQAGNKYFAAAKHNTTRYYDSVNKQWVTQHKFTVQESDDGIRWGAVKVIDPCPDFMYAEWGWSRLGDDAIIVERRRRVEAGKLTSNWDVYIGDQKMPTYYDVPMIGVNSDPKYSTIRIRFTNTYNLPEGAKGIQLRDFPLSANWDMGYVKYGTPSNAIPYVVIGSGFKKNGWSSNSYDTGGFVVINPFNGYGYAYTVDNYMIDKHNYTYENITNY